MGCGYKNCIDEYMIVYYILYTVKKWGATLHPWGTTPYWLLKIPFEVFNNQYGVVPQGCNVAPHF